MYTAIFWGVQAGLLLVGLWYPLLLAIQMALLIAMIAGNQFVSHSFYSARGCHVLITGGSSGIGLSCAKEFLSKGAHHVVILARNETRLALAKNDLEICLTQENQRITAIQADISQYEALKDKIDAHVSAYGAFDMVIAGAGHANPTTLDALQMQDFESLYKVNVFGTIATIKAVLPSMKAQGKGRIGIISSLGGLSGLYGYSSYSSSKAALRGFGECLQHEVSPYNIAVSISYPPDTETPQLTEEAKTISMITKKLSDASSVIQPEVMAHHIVDGLERGHFSVFGNFDGNLLGITTAGVSYPNSLYRLVAEVSLFPFVRIFALFLQLNWLHIIKKHHH